MTEKNKQEEVLMDDATTVFFFRELEHVRMKSYDVKKVPLHARQVFPLDFEVNEGATSVTYHQFDTFGQAKVIANYADDLDVSDVAGKEFTSNVKSLGTSFGYSFSDVRKAKMTNRPLNQMKATAARRTVAELENRVAFFGDEDSNLQGLLDNPNIPRLAAGANTSGETQWENKTPDEVLADMNTCFNTPNNLTKGTEKALDVAISNERYNYISSTYADTDNKVTILEAFKKAHQEIRNIYAVSELDEAGYNDTGVMIAYNKSPLHLQMVIPMEFIIHAPQQRNLGYKVPCEESFGG